MTKMITLSRTTHFSTQATILLKLVALFLLLIGQNTNLSAQSKAITSLTGGSNFVFNNQGFTVGYEFTANQTITVSDLGFYDAGSDGLATAHDVGIYNLCGTLLTSGNVASGIAATIDNGFRYVAVTPTVLAAGTTYRVGAVVFNGGGNDAFLNGVTTINTNAAITFKKGVTNNGVSSLQYPSLDATATGLSANSCFGPNFIFTTGGTPPTAPEIDILGNSVSIPLGTTATSTSNHTDFGTVANGSSFARTFTIDNTAGTATLTISSITSSNTKFVVASIPPSVSASGTATFTVTFTPTGYGLQSATITVTNNDCDEGSYTFTVQAMTPFTLGFGCINGTIGNYYNGGSGPNVGVAFTTGIALGGGLDGINNPIFNVPAGFTTGIAVTSTNAVGFSIRVFDGLDNTGTQLAYQNFECSPCTGSLSFTGTAKSVRIERFSAPFSYDDLTLGSTTIGSALAESTVEINVKGNGNNILDGTTTTSTTTDTDFGSVAANSSLAKTYTIENTGSGTMTISSITSNNTKFVVSNIPPSVSGNSTATFTVTFNPIASGIQNGTITVNNTDCDEAVYDFAVKGTGYNLYTFNGTTNTDWATATNWSNNAIPTSLSSGDAVVIAANCTMNDVVISFPSGTSLTVNSSRTLSPSQNTFITIASGATLTLNAAASMSQGRITNTGTMDIYGSYSAFYMTNNSGGVMNVKTGGTYACDACAQAFNAGGIVNNDGNLIIPGGGGNAGTINNNSGGVIGSGGGTQMSSSGTIVNAGSFISRNASTTGIFTNSGTLTVGAGSELFTIGNGGTFTNTGTVSIPSGNSLNISVGGSMTNSSTGIVNNNATMSVNGTFTNNGTYKGSGTYSGSLFTNPSGGIIAPGNSAGCMTFSNGFTNSGSLQIEINSTTACTGYDRITVTGTATLGGTLDLTFGYTGSGSDKATVIAATTLSGFFAAVNNIAPNWFYNTNAPATGQVTMSYNTVLPIELINFTATLAPQPPKGAFAVLLTWETANEVNNKGFQIERAPQPPKGAFETWEVLGFVNAKDKAATYEFLDKSPLWGLGVYRLRQIDNDGKETLSKMVSVSMKGNNKLKTYPNPVANTLNVETFNTGEYQVFNLLGQQVLRGQTVFQGQKPPSGVWGLDVSPLPQGTYIFKVGTEQAKFVKQ